MSKIHDDIRLEEAKKLMRQGEYEDAIGLFQSLLQARVEEFGELSVEAAQAYYEYGNALLIQQEENPSDNLLGGNENQPLETQESVEIDETAAGEDEDDEDAGEEDKGEDDDLQIAWENLDVYIRLGDLMRLEERPGEAVTEYDKARIIREKVCQPHDRELCDVYFCLAGAFIDLSAKVDESEASEKKQEALVNYRRARDVLLVRKPLMSGADVQEIEDLVDILTESIDALQVEMTSSASKSSEERPITTIGFGTPKAVGENVSSKKRSVEEVSSSEVQVLQMKKKPKEG
eukprot:gene10898-7754_t